MDTIPTLGTELITSANALCFEDGKIMWGCMVKTQSGEIYLHAKKRMLKYNYAWLTP